MHWSCIKQTCWMYGVDNDVFYIFISFYLLKPNDLIHKSYKKKKEKRKTPTTSLHPIVISSLPCSSYFSPIPMSLASHRPPLLTIPTSIPALYGTFFSNFDLNWSCTPLCCFYYHLVENHIAFLIDYKVFIFLHYHLSYASSLSEETVYLKSYTMITLPPYWPWMYITIEIDWRMTISIGIWFDLSF